MHQMMLVHMGLLACYNIGQEPTLRDLSERNQPVVNYNATHITTGFLPQRPSEFTEKGNLFREHYCNSSSVDELDRKLLQ